MTSSARRGPGRPAADDPSVQPESVLQHALRAFADQGYEAVSIRRLSTELGMGHTFISDRYGSKKELWEAVVDYAMARTAPQVGAELADEEKDDLDRLVSTVRALHRAAAESADFAALIDQEARIDSPRLAYLYELMIPVNGEIRALFDRLVGEGRLRPMPWYLFYFLITAPTSLYSQPPLARLLGRPDDADDHDLMTDLVLGGLLGPAS